MKFSTLYKNAKAAALVEYGMLVGLIAVLAIVAVNNLGSTVRDTFTQVSDTLSGSLASATTSGGGANVAEAPEASLPPGVLAQFTINAEQRGATVQVGFADDSQPEIGYGASWGTMGSWAGTLQEAGFGLYTQDGGTDRLYLFVIGDPAPLVNGGQLSCPDIQAGSFAIPNQLAGAGAFNTSWVIGGAQLMNDGQSYTCTISANS